MSQIQWEYIFNPQLALESFPYIIQGIGHTLFIALSSMAIGLFISVFLALGKMSRLLIFQLPARAYISFMRGVPVLVLLFLLYFGFPLIGIEFTAVTAAIIGFSLNSAAYGGGQSLGNSSNRPGTVGSIVFPRHDLLANVPPHYFAASGKNCPSPLVNVLLDLIKSSSLAAMITVPELFQRAKIVGGRELDYMTMYILVAFIYWGDLLRLSNFSRTSWRKNLGNVKNGKIFSSNSNRKPFNRKLDNFPLGKGTIVHDKNFLNPGNGQRVFLDK